MTLLCKGFTSQSLEEDVITLKVSFSEFNRMRGHKLVDPKLTNELLNQTHLASERCQTARLDLSEYVNRSALALPLHFSLFRTYIIFRTLGLRHLAVVDVDNRVVGILTRKDLMGFSI